MIQVGKKAPDFTMEGVIDHDFCSVSLSDYKNQWVLLFFWPLDFTFVCPTEILEFSRRKEEFDKLDTKVLGASTDSKFSHLAWLEKLGPVSFPMLSDITKEVSRNYGILIEESGIALRGTFIIDPEGVLRYMVVHDLNVGRNVDEILRVLKALQTGELCPVQWLPGEATLGKG